MTEPSGHFHPEKALSRVSEEFMENGAKSVTANDVAGLIRDADAIRQKFSEKEALKRYVGESDLFLSLIGDHRDGRYVEGTYWSIAVVAFALIYVMSPIDLIPDAVPEIGALDDAAVVALSLLMTENTLADYRAWKTNQ